MWRDGRVSQSAVRNVDNSSERDGLRSRETSTANHSGGRPWTSLTVHITTGADCIAVFERWQTSSNLPQRSALLCGDRKPHRGTQEPRNRERGGWRCDPPTSQRHRTAILFIRLRGGHGISSHAWRPLHRAQVVSRASCVKCCQGQPDDNHSEIGPPSQLWGGQSQTKPGSVSSASSATRATRTWRSLSR